MKIVRVEKCEWCPYKSWDNLCTYLQYLPIEDIMSIPAWCPLEDAQRCEWKDDGYGDYAAQCGGYFSFDHDIVDDKYCPHCGRRIEVKDGQ